MTELSLGNTIFEIFCVWIAWFIFAALFQIFYLNFCFAYLDFLNCKVQKFFISMQARHLEFWLELIQVYVLFTILLTNG